MTLNELIEKLESIRNLHGGDILVKVSYLNGIRMTSNEPAVEVYAAGSFRTGRSVVVSSVR